MQHVIDIVMANKELIAALVALLISEALPHVKSTEANSLLQLVLGLLKRKPAPEVKP
mgnify:CR=1 FL=1